MTKCRARIDYSIAVVCPTATCLDVFTDARWAAFLLLGILAMSVLSGVPTFKRKICFETRGQARPGG